MDKNKGIFHGAAGYDAVARKKIKELEKKIGPQMVEKVLFDGTVDATYQDGKYAPEGMQLIATTFVPDQTYKVTIEGESFECVAKELNAYGETASYIGNSAYLTDPDTGEPFGDDTGEPFVMITMSQNGVAAVMMAFAAPATYAADLTYAFAVKITTTEEKNASTGALQVGFILNNGSVGCSNTYAEIQAAIYDAIASVFSDDISKLGSVPHAVLTSFGPSIVSYHCVAVDATEMGVPGVATMAMAVSNIKFYFQNGEEKYMVQMYEDGSIQHYDLNAAG